MFSKFRLDLVILNFINWLDLVILNIDLHNFIYLFLIQNNIYRKKIITVISLHQHINHFIGIMLFNKSFIYTIFGILRIH
jgi:hypothetical protein